MRSPRGLSCLVCLGLLGACAAPPAAPPRRLELATVVGPDGRSPPLSAMVPSGTRGISIVVDGAPDTTYQLAHATLGAQALASPQAWPRLGRFAITLPGGRGPVPPGPLRWVVAGDRPGPVTVTLRLPPTVDAARLRLDVVRVSAVDGPALGPWWDEAARILADAGITLEAVAQRTVVAPTLARLVEQVEPQETPTSAAGRLAGAIAALPGGEVAADDVLDLFVVDALPAGVGGLALGVPCAPPPGLYAGVVALGDGPPAARGRVIAHELAHCLGLAHVVDGAARDDGLASTRPGMPNLMGTAGTELTAEQLAVLRRSPLLEPR
ncbi:MAG: hypothetical protein R2939_04120 [Kofleriaceae bacterium]